MISEKEKEVVREYKINSFPQIVVEESIDHKTGEIFNPPKLNYYKGNNKILKIKDYINKFATEQRLNESEMIRIFQRAIDEEKTKLPTLFPLTATNVSVVFESEDPVLVYVSRSNEIPSVVKEFSESIK
jgi:hypothetical protein